MATSLASHAPSDLYNPAEMHDLASRIDFPALLQHDGIELHQRGSKLWAKCWMHSDINPSVQITPPEKTRNGRWRLNCFGCNQVKMDDIEYIRTRGGHKLTWRDTADELRRLAGVGATAGPRLVRKPIESIYMPAEQQSAAVKAFLDLVDATVPRALDRGQVWLREVRGLPEDSATPYGGIRWLSRNDLHQIRDLCADSLWREEFLRAGIARDDADHTGTPRFRLPWFDDVAMGTCHDLDGRPMFLWARRRDPLTFLPDMKCCNQMTEHGSMIYPYGMSAIHDAERYSVPLRYVEGPATSLGSRCLRDGRQLPTTALLGRLEAPTPGSPRHRLWQRMIPRLQRVVAVEVCPDNDTKPKTRIEGITMGLGLVRYLRDNRVNAWLRTFTSENLPAAGDPNFDLCARPFQYAGFKDFNDVARSQIASTR